MVYKVHFGLPRESTTVCPTFGIFGIHRDTDVSLLYLHVAKNSEKEVSEREGLPQRNNPSGM